MERKLLKPAEVAEILRIGRSLVYGMLATGELPSIRVGRCIRVSSERLDEWIKKQERQGGLTEAVVASATSVSRGNQ
jgi:excisionase family DNA binding protein